MDMGILTASRNRIANSLLALGLIACAAPAVKAQEAVYNNLIAPQIDPRNNSTRWIGTDSNFVTESNFSGANGLPTLVSGMMLDDIYLHRQPGAFSATINSITVAVANGNVGVDMNVRVYLRIYDNNGQAPASNSADGPGTLLKAVDIGTVSLAGATADTDPSNGTRGIVSFSDDGNDANDSLRFLTVSSSSLQGLTLPFNAENDQSFYWFGLFFEQDRDTNLTLQQQAVQLGQVGQAFYSGAGIGLNNTSPTGGSADVIHETAVIAQAKQKDRFTQGFGPDEPNGIRERFIELTGRTDGSANFGWGVNATFNVPEPGALSLVLLGGIPFIRRRRSQK